MSDPDPTRDKPGHNESKKVSSEFSMFVLCYRDNIHNGMCKWHMVDFVDAVIHYKLLHVIAEQWGVSNNKSHNSVIVTTFAMQKKVGLPIVIL